MQGPISNPPLIQPLTSWTLLILIMKLKLKKVHFSAYPKSSPINENQKTSELTSRENEESQKYNNATGSYDQVYVDTPLSRQLQNEESNSLEQRVDVLIKKGELIQNRRSSVNGHYVLNLCKYEHSMQIDLNGYAFEANRQKHRKMLSNIPHEDHELEQIHLYHSGNCNLPSWLCQL